MANEVNDKLKTYIRHLAKVFSEKTKINLSEEYLVSQVLSLNEDYNKEEIAYRKSDNLPNVYPNALKDFTMQLFKDIMYTYEGKEVEEPAKELSQSPYGKIVTESYNNIDSFMMEFDELITSISIAYINANRKNKTKLTNDSHKPFGGMKARDFAEILKPIRDYSITIGDKVKIDSNCSMNILMNDLERGVRGIKGFHEMEKSNSLYTGDTGHLRELDDKNELYQNAFNLAKNKDAHNFAKDFVSYKESLAQDIEKMAATYTLLRDQYHSKSFGHKWFTSEGWAQSSAINTARKQMKKALGIKTDKEFNNIMRQISEKDSKFTADIGKVVNNLNDLYNKKKEDYQQNITDNLIKIGYLKQNVVIPDEKVNDNSKVDEALIDISGNQKENVIDTSKVK